MQTLLRAGEEAEVGADEVEIGSLLLKPTEASDHPSYHLSSHDNSSTLCTQQLGKQYNCCSLTASLC